MVTSPAPENSRWHRVSLAIQSWWRQREQWQRWAMVIAAAIVLVLTIERWQRWDLTSRKNLRQKTWEREGVIRLDENGDGIIDQEQRPGKAPGEFIILKDANFDGTFDVRYRQTTNGLATGLEAIKETAPRH
ncbi:MAG: hypothetical protein K0Q55_2762 [Verrucomicrobia bacterium]|jgi:hypothetical protein|nr:hypothetical protein [Verrucomicrobiota bacterium]